MRNTAMCPILLAVHQKSEMNGLCARGIGYLTSVSGRHGSCHMTSDISLPTGQKLQMHLHICLYTVLMALDLHLLSSKQLDPED